MRADRLAVAPKTEVRESRSDPAAATAHLGARVRQARSAIRTTSIHAQVDHVHFDLAPSPVRKHCHGIDRPAAMSARPIPARVIETLECCINCVAGAEHVTFRFSSTIAATDATTQSIQAGTRFQRSHRQRRAGCGHRRLESEQPDIVHVPTPLDSVGWCCSGGVGDVTGEEHEPG